MGLRLVKGASKGGSRSGAKGAQAFLLVTSSGAIIHALGWETVSADPAPGRLGSGATENPILGAIRDTVAVALKSRRPAGCCVEVSLERSHVYCVAAAALPGKGRSGEVAVVVQEAPVPEAGRAEGKVIRQLGHDLRTPLTSISGAVELLQSGRLGALQPQQERVLGMTQKGVDAMVRLIDTATEPYRKDLAAELDLEGLEDGGPAEAPTGSKGGRR